MITTAFQPSALSVDRLLALSEATFDRVILITGVPANKDGEPMWASLDEAAVSGHPHGLLAAIDTIAHNTNGWPWSIHFDHRLPLKR